MHIKTPQSALLSNHEVLLHLQAEQAEYTGDDGTRRGRKIPVGLEELLKDGIHYLTTPDYALTNLTETHPTRPMTLYKGPHSLLRALAPTYRLNKAEYLQIYNVRPRTRIALELIIEEANTRFSDVQLDELLASIIAVFDEEEEQIPPGVEDVQMERLDEKMLGASRGRKKRGGPKKT